VREQRVIVGVRELQSLDDGPHRGGFGCAKPGILQIEIVNNPGKPLDRGLLDAKDGAQRLEGAAFALMTL
jgi:hypothetical protein